METNVHYTLVGIFVITLFAFIVFCIIWLSSGLAPGQYKTYKIYMKESVTGLNIDSAVEFNGVDVGTVKSIEIDTHDPHLVIVLLNIQNNTPITRGTRATLNTKGLTGVAYIALLDNGKDITPLALVPGQPYPIIETAPSFLWRLDTGMQKLSENLSKTATMIEALLNDKNLHSINAILVNIQQVTDTLAANTKQMNSILRNTAHASEQFYPLIQSSKNIASTINVQILPATSQALMNLNTLTKNLSELAIELKHNPAMIIRGQVPSTLGPGE